MKKNQLSAGKNY